MAKKAGRKAMAATAQQTEHKAVRLDLTPEAHRLLRMVAAHAGVSMAAYARDAWSSSSGGSETARDQNLIRPENPDEQGSAGGAERPIGIGGRQPRTEVGRRRVGR